MIPTREECIELLRKHDAKEKKIEHTLLVEKVCLFLGKRLIEAGEDVNLKILSRAALLHDIGKDEARKTGKKHEIAGYEICRKEDIDEDICRLVKKHVLEAVNKPLNTWEEKIILYADKICKHNVIGVEKRFEPWFRHDVFKDRKEELEANKQKIKELEKEICGKAGIKPEEIGEML